MEASISKFDWGKRYYHEPMYAIDVSGVDLPDPAEQMIITLQKENMSLVNENEQLWKAGDMNAAELEEFKKALESSTAKVSSCIQGLNHWIHEYNEEHARKQSWIKACVLASLIALFAGIKAWVPQKIGTDADIDIGDKPVKKLQNDVALPKHTDIVSDDFNNR